MLAFSGGDDYPSKMPGFFAELQRRKVYRVAAGYIIAAGFIIQMASAVFPAWELPNWSLRLLIVVILAGFPIGLIGAWVFDLTSGGLVRSPGTVEGIALAAVPSHRRRNIILLGIVGLIVSVAAGFFVLPGAIAHKVDKSIAVLPFENLSADQENAFFADGVQDDILTNLSKIGDLKVISRTSVMPYRGQNKNLRDIGKALGVANILEGSVRRYGNKVRVNVQLIDASNDKHIWAKDYDGDMSDVFKVQTEFATEIASALQAKLSPKEKAEIERKPTQNEEAYFAFKQAWAACSNMEDFAPLKGAEQQFDKAIALDPKFALALARYSQMESWIYRNFDPTPARREKAVQLADRALAVDPELSEAHLARGFAYYYGDRDYAAALEEFAVAQRGLPNESEGFLAIGAIERRQGKWDESTANLIKAAERDPKSTWPLQNLAFNYQMLHKLDRAIETIDRALVLEPKSASLVGLKAQFAIEGSGDFSVAEKAFAELVSQAKAGATPEASATVSALRLPNDMSPAHLRISWMNVLLLQRKFADIIREAPTIDDKELATKPETLILKYGCLGIAYHYSQKEAESRRALTTAKEYAQKLLAEAPENAPRHVALAFTEAWLGEKDAAKAEAQRATKLLPESIDHFEGPQITQNVAEVYALSGDADHAIELLDGLFNRPSAITVALLKLQPSWDPIRNDPRFQALIQKYGRG